MTFKSRCQCSQTTDSNPVVKRLISCDLLQQASAEGNFEGGFCWEIHFDGGRFFSVKNGGWIMIDGWPPLFHLSFLAGKWEGERFLLLRKVKLIKAGYCVAGKVIVRMEGYASRDR